MKKATPEPFPERAPSVRRTFEKLEIEDGERRARIRDLFRRLFGRRERGAPPRPGR